MVNEDRKVVSPCMAVFPTISTWCGKVDVRLPGKGDRKSHGARPVHLIITMIEWIQ